MKRDECWRRWLPFCAIVIFVGVVIACADAGAARGVFGWIERHAGSDKIGHFVLIGTLAWTLNHALRGRSIPAGCIGVQVGGLIIAVVMTIEEVSQMWIPGRNFDLHDLGANYAGILVANWISGWRK